MYSQISKNDTSIFKRLHFRKKRNCPTQQQVGVPFVGHWAHCEAFCGALCNAPQWLMQSVSAVNHMTGMTILETKS